MLATDTGKNSSLPVSMQIQADTKDVFKYLKYYSVLNTAEGFSFTLGVVDISTVCLIFQRVRLINKE